MKRHQLLFVDDEKNVLRSLERLFIEEGRYEIFTALSGHDGIKLLKENDVSLILSDYRMPEMDGVEFLKIAKEKSPDTIRMILTGFADVDVAISAINEGEIFKFIEKPWESEKLKVEISKALEHFNLVKERKELLEKINKQNVELKKWNENLEKRVEEKTKELKLAYEKLQLKMKELEGRDKILQFLLTIQSLEDTLYLILDVIMDIKIFDKIIMYVVDNKKKKMYPRVGLLIKNTKKLRIGSEIVKFPALPIPKLTHDDKSLLAGTSPTNKINEYSYFVPIEKEGECLGVIMVDNSEIKKQIKQDDLRILAGFSSLAALAINEHLVTANLTDWQDQIDDLLEEFK